MLKFIVPVVFISVIIGVSFYLITKDQRDESGTPSPLVSSTEDTNQSDLPADLPREVPKDLPTPSQSPKASANTTEGKIQNLEAIVSELSKRISALEQSPSPIVQLPTSTTSTTTTTSTAKYPLYIPIGTGGGSSAFDWTTINTSEVEIDPADYSGYTNMYLEVELKSYQGNGRAYARLINYTDSTGLAASEVSTTSENYTTVVSSGFKLGSGKKKYRLQLKTLTGYEASTQSVRIKVVF